MTNGDRERARLWLAQSQNDLLYAKSAARDGFYAQTCFICQQVAEKALKSMLFKRGAKVAFTHSIRELCRTLRINGKLLQAAGVLDQYYLTGRYPDALPGVAPFEVFTKTQAQEALAKASVFVKKART